MSEVATLQAEAGAQLVEGIEADDRTKEMAERTAHDAAVLNYALKVFDDMRNPEKELRRVLLSPDKPVPVEPLVTTPKP